VQRFRLLRFYVIGVVAVVVLAAWGFSKWRTAADSGTLQAAVRGTVTPSTMSSDRSTSGANAWQTSPTTATTQTATRARPRS
jgi:hypothetical protein